MTNTKQKSTVALAAAGIRASLKAAFAETKFSVRSESFSMGNAVNISWADGPTESQVNEVVSRFRDGDFNGMTDMYNNASKDASTPHRAKYVSCHREISEEVSRAVREGIDALWSDAPNCASWRALQDADLRGGYDGVLIDDCGRVVVVTKEKRS